MTNAEGMTNDESHCYPNYVIGVLSLFRDSSFELRHQKITPLFRRPKPLTSVTVIPSMPSSASASLTSSSLNGLMMASSFFMSEQTQRRLVSRDRSETQHALS